MYLNPAAASSDARLFESSASAPSMRASEPIPAHLAQQMDFATRAVADDNGNVKVVVRVRKFVRRGSLPRILNKQCTI
jgi:hypothetical protein